MDCTPGENTANSQRSLAVNDKVAEDYMQQQRLLGLQQVLLEHVACARR
jgi:hypothetical protein